MTDQPRNWDKELADIDRVIEKEGAAPRSTPAALPPGAPAGSAGRLPAPVHPAPPRGSVAMTWFWVALAVLLAAALPLWPYGKTCGLQLFFYLGAATLALLAGAAGAVHSWRTRRGFAHLLALVAVVVVAVIFAREVLPRIGYAAESQTWLCPSVPEPASPQAVPQDQTQPSPTGL